MSYPIDISVKPEVKGFFDPATNTISYVVKDPNSTPAPSSIPSWTSTMPPAASATSTPTRSSTTSGTTGCDVEWLIETHVHADHLSAAPYIQGKLGGKLGIGENITVVQDTFGKIFNEGTEFQRDGSQFDRLFEDGDTYTIGTMTAFAMHTPGHTPACMTHVIGDAAFVGDTLFMPDGGSARADFPGGDARHALPTRSRRCWPCRTETRLFMCHDYGPNGRDIRWETTVADEKAHNIHVREGISRGGVREDARGPRRDPRHAEADHPVAAGEHARRRAAAEPTRAASDS